MEDRIKCFLIVPVYDVRGGIIRWSNPETNEEHEFIHQFSAGAMFYCPWLERRVAREAEVTPPSSHWCHLGIDGRVLGVLTPGGEWIIDSRASNCTMPDDNAHSCWVRHGIPPYVTVDKRGNSCKAGSGSIDTGRYHGKLTSGYLERC